MQTAWTTCLELGRRSVVWNGGIRKKEDKRKVEQRGGRGTKVDSAA
jgi:hypothetical protein